MSIDKFDTPERQENPPIGALRLSPTLQKDLVQYVKTEFTDFSLSDLLQTRAQRDVQKAYEAELSRRGLTGMSSAPEPILDAFSKMFEQIAHGKESGDVKVRWVVAGSANELTNIVSGAAIDGGKRGNLVGVCVDVPGGKGDDTMRMGLSSGVPSGVLFIYDSSKLEPLSETEMQSDSSFSAGYGVKPIQGETFRSALLGAIVI